MNKHLINQADMSLVFLFIRDGSGRNREKNRFYTH
nr:MAG TPA: hypothetical protein [Caudoviricetes sp.]